MKYYLIFICFIFFPFTTKAQWVKVLGKNNVPSQSVSTFKYENNLFICGDNGIYYSRDNGQVWKTLRPDYFLESDEIKSFDCVANKYGIFALFAKRSFGVRDNDSTFLVFTPDFGKTWKINYISTAKGLILQSPSPKAKLIQKNAFIYVEIGGSFANNYQQTLFKLKIDSREIINIPKVADRNIDINSFYTLENADYAVYPLVVDIYHSNGTITSKSIPYNSSSYWMIKDSLLCIDGNPYNRPQFSKDFGQTWYEAGNSLPLIIRESLSSSLEFPFRFSNKNKIYYIVKSNIYSSSDNGLNWVSESDSLRKYTGNFNPFFEIRDSILTFTSCYSNTLPACDKKYIYNILTKKITYLNTEIVQNTKFLNFNDKIVKLSNGKLLKATEQNPHVNYLSENQGETWKNSTEYPYFFDKIQINDSTFYVFDYYNHFDSQNKPVVKFVNNLRKDTLLESSFLAFTNWVQKGDTIVAYPKGYNDTIVYSTKKPYDKWIKVPTKNLSNTIVFFDKGKIFSYYPWGDTKLDLFDLNGTIQKTTASEYGSTLLNISEPNNLWFGSLGAIYNTKDLGITKRRIFIPLPNSYSSGDVPDVGMLAIIKKNNIPQEKTMVVVARNAPHISVDSGKTWILFNLGLEKDISYKVQQVDSFLFVITNRGMYRRSLADIDLRSVSGTVFQDINGNNIWDKNELGVLNAKIYSKTNGAITYTDSLGRYNLISDVIAMDTLTANFENKYATIFPNFYALSKSDTGKNFAIELAANVNDLKGSLTAITSPRPGFNNSYLLNYKNVGSTVANGKLSLQYNAKQTLVASTSPVDNNTNQTLIWNYSNLQPNESRELQVAFKTSIDVPIGSQITNILIIDPLIIDTFKADNIDTLIQTVVGSFDPNDKQVTFNNSKTPPSVIDPSTELIYTIRFQNTGNYPADFVTVVDTLSDKLDLTTFRLIATSHKGSVSVRNKNVLTFDFNPIYLPDSLRDEVGSHGFVKFAIKPKKTLTKDEAIKNTAYIFFDYNEAVITNTVESANQKINNLFTPSVSAGKLEISPNPAQHSIKVDIEDSNFKQGILSIYDLSGRLMFTKSITDKTVVIDVSHLSVGEYICTIKSLHNKIFVNKFVKVQ